MHVKNLIDGQLKDAAACIECINPATAEPFGTAPDSAGSDIDLAVTSARSAFADWSRTSPDIRAACLYRLAQAVEDQIDTFAELECRDSGKPLSQARNLDIPRVVSNLRFFAAAATQFATEAHCAPGQSINYTLRQPVGPVACISPWNLPLYLFSWKIAPALAAGCTVVGKPSEVTPCTAGLLSELVEASGFPPGVLNIVHGTGATTGAALVRHPDIKAVSFTGSTRAGRWIATELAPRFVKASLEMGGKNPFIVFADADWDLALDTCLRAAFANQGQICLCGSRILVEKSIYTEFRDALVDRARALVVGDPLLKTTDQGALVSREHQAKVLDCLQTARDEGANVLCGGRPVTVEGRCSGGYFVAPTLLDGLGPETQTNQQEIFGPVASLQPFDTEEHAVELANASEYGLAASVLSRDVSRCHRVAADIHAGILWINCWLVRDLRTPFGGVKQSGVGREGGVEAMRFFTEPKNICILP